MSGARVTGECRGRAAEVLASCEGMDWQHRVGVVAQALADAEAGEREAIAQEGDARISELEAADLPCLAFKVFVEIIRARGEATS